jgi:RNA polymerase sigma-70 factor (ECF subfamily)
MEPDDATLLARIATGDGAAVETFYNRWFPQFARLATRLTGDGAAGEDLAQEAVVRVITRAGSYDAGESARCWLLTIVRHLVCDKFRRDDVRRAASLSAPDGGPSALQVADRAPTPPERIAARERAAAVHHALTGLSDDERDVILLRDYEGFSAPETARMLGISVGLVGSRLFRARRRLGAALQTGWPDLFPPGTI